jgi:hypothetical protein
MWSAESHYVPLSRPPLPGRGRPAGAPNSKQRVLQQCHSSVTVKLQWWCYKISMFMFHLVVLVSLVFVSIITHIARGAAALQAHLIEYIKSVKTV